MYKKAWHRGAFCNLRLLALVRPCGQPNKAVTCLLKVGFERCDFSSIASILIRPHEASWKTEVPNPICMTPEAQLSLKVLTRRSNRHSPYRPQHGSRRTELETSSWAYLDGIEVEISFIASRGHTGGRPSTHANSVCRTPNLDYQHAYVWGPFLQVVMIYLSQPSAARCVTNNY